MPSLLNISPRHLAWPSAVGRRSQPEALWVIDLSDSPISEAERNREIGTPQQNSQKPVPNFLSLRITNRLHLRLGSAKEERLASGFFLQYNNLLISC